MDVHSIFRHARAMFLPRAFGATLLLIVLPVCEKGFSESLPVRHAEGVTHGFLTLRNESGRIIAYGELIQDTNGNQVTSELLFRFKDGSVQDETAVFTQQKTFALVSDHLIQKGPTFSESLDRTIDLQKQTVQGQHMELPAELCNGMLFVLVKNLPNSFSELRLPMLAPTAKPQLVTFVITQSGDRSFNAGGKMEQAAEYTMKIDIGGIKGKIAPLVGKQPPDMHMWVSKGKAPTVLAFEGPLSSGGAVWRIDVTAAKLSAAHKGKAK